MPGASNVLNLVNLLVGLIVFQQWCASLYRWR